MKIRLPFRRRTTQAVADSGPVWAQRSHFRVGDDVVLCDNRPATVAYIEDEGIGIKALGWYSPGLIRERDAIRHSNACPPCQSDHARRLGEDQHRETAYWNRWSEDERNTHAFILEDLELTAGSEPSSCPSDRARYQFGSTSPVREWMRTEFDGHMVESESPSLSLGRIWDSLDWDRIEREHAGDGLTFATPWADHCEWPVIRRAYTLLRENGLDVVLDCDLEMVLHDDGPIGIQVEPTLITVKGVVPDEIARQVTAILGHEPEGPHSSLGRPGHPDRSGTDFTAPYVSHTYEHTMWSWTS
ncbi:hypothetical protein ACODT4_44240 [Streptomyces sp. 2.9]|uniref:hypothetical protein n=1 Tax=Streptomyces tritrimontium TaxID=3406573 RepID=UPI003BB5AB51